MKILYHHRIRSKDGQFVHVSELVSALERQQVEVLVVGPKATDQADFGDDGGFVATLKDRLPRWLYECLELLYGSWAAIRLWRATRAFQPDAIYERYNLHAPAGTLVRKLTKVPLILEINAPLAEERASHDGLAMKGLAFAIEGWIWRSADEIVAVTNVLAHRIETAGADPAKIHVMSNGVDPQKFAICAGSKAARERFGLGDGLILGFVGFVRAWHGLDAVIDWMGSHREKQLTLAIAGDGPYLTTLVAKARRFGIEDRVRILGLVARDDVPLLLQTFDIALQPAAVDYASPLKLIEYMAAGCAILAPDQPNIKETVKNGENALLFEPDGLTDAMQRLLDDPGLRQKLGNNARQSIQALGLTWDQNALRVKELVVKNRPKVQ